MSLHPFMALKGSSQSLSPCRSPRAWLVLSRPSTHPWPGHQLPGLTISALSAFLPAVLVAMLPQQGWLPIASVPTSGTQIPGSTLAPGD